jgi:tetratricopeptide (TPR) repeat protein
LVVPGKWTVFSVEPCLTTHQIAYALKRALISYRLYFQELYDSCAKDCTKALDLHPHYLKARVRRAQSYERADKLEEALEDYAKVIELDPAHAQAREACMVSEGSGAHFTKAFRRKKAPKLV